VGRPLTSRPGVAIVGCGLIGRKRAATLGPARLVACADVEPARASALAATVPGAAAFDRWEDAVAHPDVDLVVVATTNDALAPVATAAVDAGKHVLVEKPAARTVAEIDPLIAAARRHDRRVRVGFNHRYHPALIQAKALVDVGALGALMFVRGRYGHGGRVGYEREWRADPARSGGGELIDQGVHLIDLAGWFLGPFTEVQGTAATLFWDMPVDDNAFMTLKTGAGRIAFLHVSCSEWKNLFSLEIYGRDGKIAIDGLGGSYGLERLAHYRMLPEMGPPETTIYEYPRGDASWAIEFAEFLEDIRLDREPAAGLEAARAALVVVQQVYAQSGPTAAAAEPVSPR
jgi:predicted dehydrogenase